MSRKLRNFSEVIGHKAQVDFLIKHVADDNIADVIIFTGRPGIGKSSLAKILACEIACRYESKELLEEYKTAVINNNQSTDSVRLYNMSAIQEKEEEIQKVTADLSIGFSKTKRKILVLDEAHNMSKKAQDAILTELEHLQQGVYVFICTTEVNALRAALQSRSKATFNLNGLSDIEASTVIRNCIQERKLTFDISTDLAVTYIREWANNEPRKMCNLLDNFEEGSLVKARDLEVFINMTNSSVVIELMKYLYGSMVLGIEYLESVKYDESFISMLIEVCKVIMGHTSKSISNKETIYIKQFMNDKDPNYFMKLTAGICGLGDLRKRKVISVFMKSHVSYEEGVKPRKGLSQEAWVKDLRELSENIETPALRVNTQEEDISVVSIEELFENADIVAEDMLLNYSNDIPMDLNAMGILQEVEKKDV